MQHAQDRTAARDTFRKHESSGENNARVFVEMILVWSPFVKCIMQSLSEISSKCRKKK